MDIFSHLFSSYAIGLSFKDKNRHIFFVLGGILPDFDMFLYPIAMTSPYLFLLKHRTLFHSPFLVWLWAIIWYAITIKLLDIRYSVDTLAITLIGAYYHLALDFLTTSSIHLYPFGNLARIPIFNGDTLVIEVFNGALALIILILYGRKIITYVIKREFSKLAEFLFNGNFKRNFQKVLKVYLLVFSIVLLFHAMQYYHLQNISQNYPGKTAVIAPRLYNSVDWFIIKDEGDTYRIIYYNIFNGITGEEVFEKVEIINGSIIEAYIAIEIAKDNPYIRELLYSGKPYIIKAYQRTDGTWVTIWINIERYIDAGFPFVSMIRRYKTTVEIKLR